jgi:hypothetical protein
MRDAQMIEGGHDARVKLKGVFERLLSGADASSEPIEVTLYQVAKSGELSINNMSYDFDGSIDEFIKEIVDEAENDAIEHRGKVKYAVRVKGKQLRSVFVLKIPDIEDDDDDFEDLDELPNRRGLIQQQMRHTEVFAKEMIASTKNDRTFMYNMIRDLQQENQALKRQWFEGQAIIENLRNMQFARDMEVEKIRKAENRKDQMAGGLLQMAGQIGTKLLGGGAAQAEQTPLERLGQRTPLEGMVEQLFASLEQKQGTLEKIAQVLDPAELANLAGIHQYIAERREKEEEMKRAQTQGGTPGANGQSTHYPYPPYTAPPVSQNGAGVPPYTGANGATPGT